MQAFKPVLITGAGGYIGSHTVLKALDSRQEVIAVDTFEGGKDHFKLIASHSRCRVLKKRVSELERGDFEGVSHVIHLAALAGTKLCEERPEEALKTNLEDTIHLCHVANDKPIFFTNTNIGYPKGFSDETAEMKSENVYGRTKIEAERVILEHGGVSLRLASVFGISPKMRDDLLLHFLVKEFVEKNTIEVFDMDSMRNFVHVEDVATILLHPWGLRGGEAYNLSFEEHFNKRTLIAEIQKHLSYRYVYESEKKDPDQRDYHLSTEKIRTHRNFTPLASPREEIPRLIKYYEFAKM
jgi:nucleoside-diphosphate-sugar epimerase